MSTTLGPPPAQTERAYSFTDHSIHQPSVPQPGDRLDEEFDVLYSHAQYTRALLDQIFTPAGLIHPGSITMEHLDPAIRDILFNDIREDLSGQISLAMAQSAYAGASADHAHNEATRATQMANEAAIHANQANTRAVEALALIAEAAQIATAVDQDATETENFANDAELSANKAHLDQELAGAWAEFLEGNEPIPAMYFDHTGITGQHWSSRFWAIKAAGAFGALAELYLGVHATPPTETNTGEPIPIGAIYYNSVSGQPYIWNGTEWVPFYAPTKALTLSLIYQATAGQTVFNLTTLDLAANSYSIDATTPEPLDVYLNGVRLPSNAATAGLGDWTLDPVTSVLTLASPTKAGDLVHVDILTPAANLAPSRVQTLTLMDFDIDPDTDLPGQIDGTRTVFPLMLVGPPHVPVSVNSAQELFVSVDGVVQQPGIDFSTIGGDSIAFAEAPTLGAKAWAQWYGANDLDMGSGSGGFGGVISIRQFGASPANTPEQNVIAFQAAIDYGGLIYVDAGEYLINYFVLPKSFCTLRGAGIGKTIITRTGIPDAFSNPGTIFRHWSNPVEQGDLQHFMVTDMTLQSDTMGETGIFAQVIWDRCSSHDITFARCQFRPVPGTEETAFFNSFLGVTGDYNVILKDHLIIDCIFEDVHRLVIEMLNQHWIWTPDFGYPPNSIVNPGYWPAYPDYPFIPVPHELDYIVRAGGTTSVSDGSEASMPVWPLVVGETVTDGTAIFECIPKQFNIQNHRTIRCQFRRNKYGWPHSFSGPAKGCLVKDCVFEEGCCNPGSGIVDGHYTPGTMICENAGASWSVWEGNKFYNWGRSNCIQSSEPGTYMKGNAYRNNIFIVTDDKQPDYVGAGDWNGTPISLGYNHNSQVHDNYIYMGFGSGIGARACTEINVHNNWIRALGENANGFENCHECLFTDNYVSNLGCPIPSQSGVIFWAGSTHNLATRNVFKIKAGSINMGAWDQALGNSSVDFGNWIDIGAVDQGTPGSQPTLGQQGQPRSVWGFGAFPGGDPIQNAAGFARAAQAGGTIWVPKGVYDLDGTILPVSGARFVGDGIDTTILRQVGTGYDKSGIIFRLYESAPVIGFGVEDMTLIATSTLSVTPFNAGTGLIWVERETIESWDIRRVKFISEDNHTPDPGNPTTEWGTNGVALFTDRYNKTMKNIVFSDCIFQGTAADGLGIAGALPATWAASTLFNTGVWLAPQPMVFECTVAGQAAGIEPNWPTAIGVDTVSGGATFRSVVSANSLEAFQPNQTYTVAWQVAATKKLFPVDYLVIEGGTTAAAPPVWPLVPGNPDGSNDFMNGTCKMRAIPRVVTLQDITIQRCVFNRIGMYSYGSGIAFGGRALRFNILDNTFGPTITAPGLLAPPGGNQLENAGGSYSIIRGNRFIGFGPRLPLRVVTTPPFIEHNLYVENEFYDPLSTGAGIIDIHDEHDSTFAGNRITLGAASIIIWDSARLDIRNNTIIATSDVPLIFWHPVDYTIRENTIDNTRAASNFAPMILNGGASTLVTANTFRLFPGFNRTPYLDGSGVNHRTTDGNYDVSGEVISFSGYPVPDTVTRRYVRVKTAGYTIVAADLGSTIQYTGAAADVLALTAPATLGDGWWCTIKHDGVGATAAAKLLSITPASGLLDGLASIVVYPGDVRTIHCDGVNFFSTLIKGGTLEIAYTDSPFSFVAPTGARRYEVELWGGGGPGGGGRRGAAGTARAGGTGGSGGSYVPKRFRYSDLSAGAITVTVPGFTASVPPNTVDDTNGAALTNTLGGETLFGTIFSAYGGAWGLGGTNATVASTAGAGVLAPGGQVTGGEPNAGAATSGQFGGSYPASAGQAGKPSGWGGASGGGAPVTAIARAGGASFMGGPGGGAGAAILSTNLPGVAGDGGGQRYTTAGTGFGGPGGVAGTSGVAGTNGGTGLMLAPGAAGQGGGGGGCGFDNTAGGTASAAGNGGDGGVAAGGGGGGASLNGQVAGGGGRGGPGLARITYGP